MRREKDRVESPPVFGLPLAIAATSVVPLLYLRHNRVKLVAQEIFG
jgi:hypothetical protein